MPGGLYRARVPGADKFRTPVEAQSRFEQRGELTPRQYSQMAPKAGVPRGLYELTPDRGSFMIQTNQRSGLGARF